MNCAGYSTRSQCPLRRKSPSVSCSSLSASLLWDLELRIYDSFLLGNQSWKDIAFEKRCRDMDKIPKDWILSESVMKKSKATRSIAGHFIEDLLDEETLLITKLDVPEIVERTSNGSLTAVKVVTGYSRRAAYAHQLVSHCPVLDKSHIKLFNSRTFFLKSPLISPLKELRSLTNISRRTRNPLVLCMESLSRSKTSSTSRDSSFIYFLMVA